MHVEAEDDERRLFALDVRVGVGVKLDKHDVVAARRQYWLYQVEKFCRAVDDDHLLHRAPLRPVRIQETCHRRLSLSLGNSTRDDDSRCFPATTVRTGEDTHRLRWNCR